MMRDYDDLPYFDEAGNDYIREIQRQDAYVNRGGKLSAPQMIKYENRVSMLVERLVLVLEALGQDAEALHDYLFSIEQNYKNGSLPKQVYSRFMEKVQKAGQEQTYRSERDRDRLRVIEGGVKHETTSLSDLPVDQLLEMHQQRRISNEQLFQQFSMRERSGVKLQKMDRNLWSRYKGWVAEKRRTRQRPRNHER